MLSYSRLYYTMRRQYMHHHLAWPCRYTVPIHRPQTYPLTHVPVWNILQNITQGTMLQGSHYGLPCTTRNYLKPLYTSLSHYVLHCATTTMYPVSQDITQSYSMHYYITPGYTMLLRTIRCYPRLLCAYSVLLSVTLCTMYYCITLGYSIHTLGH